MLQGVIEVLASYQNFFHSFRINFEIVFKLIKSKQKNWNTVYSLLTDTSIRWTPLKNGHSELVFAFLYFLFLALYKTDISLRRTHTAGPQGVRLRKSWLYRVGCGIEVWIFFFTLSGPKVYVDIWGFKSQKGRRWNINHICYHCHDPWSPKLFPKTTWPHVYPARLLTFLAR